MACIIPFPARPAPSARPSSTAKPDRDQEYAALRDQIRALLFDAAEPAPAAAPHPAQAEAKADVSTVRILWQRVEQLMARVKELEAAAEKFSPPSHPRGKRRAASSSASIQPA